MKEDTQMLRLITAVGALSLLAAFAVAQPPEGGQRGQRGMRADGIAQNNPMERMLENFDANDDGILQVSELASGERFQGLREADTNVDGTLSSEEIATHFQNFRRGQGRGWNIQQMIERHDANGDGQIQVTELPEGRMSERLTGADTNEDGVISAEEFQVLREQTPPPGRGPATTQPQ